VRGVARWTAEPDTESHPDEDPAAMKKARLVCALLAITTFASCLAGPHQLKRTVDDWDQKMYVDQPWLDGVLWFVPVFPVAGFLAAIGDFFVTDAYAFWLKDAWDGKGTAFTHYSVKATDGAMSSLLNEDAHFLEIK
jgi:hypothetical protein